MSVFYVLRQVVSTFGFEITERAFMWFFFNTTQIQQMQSQTLAVFHLLVANWTFVRICWISTVLDCYVKNQSHLILSRIFAVSTIKLWWQESLWFWFLKKLLVHARNVDELEFVIFVNVTTNASFRFVAFFAIRAGKYFVANNSSWKITRKTSIKIIVFKFRTC